MADCLNRESLAITITTYQISDADVGTTIGPQNGFVTGLTMLSPPTVYEQPDRDPGRQLFKSGYFTIRGECDLRPVFNAQIGAGGGHFSYWGGEAHSIVDGNFPYKGALKIVSVPKGSTRQVRFQTSQMTKRQRRLNKFQRLELCFARRPLRPSQSATGPLRWSARCCRGS